MTIRRAPHTSLSGRALNTLKLANSAVKETQKEEEEEEEEEEAAKE